MILFESRARKNVELFHRNYWHIVIRLLQFEIERRGLFINKLTYIIKESVENWKI